jgi:ABC-type transporter Mla subunit MlaD
MALDELRRTQQQVQQEVDSAEQAVGRTVQQLDQHLQQLDATAPVSHKTYTEQILRARTPPAPETKLPEQQRFPID